jgi:uncharacterized protein YciI
MRFDHYTVTLLIQRDDAPRLADDALDALQDGHLAHLAELHEAGHLLAAGPVSGGPDRELRGLSIWRGDPENVRALLEAHPDPAVTAGRLREEVIPWMVPSGALHFTPTRFPRSTAEARA